MNSDKNDIVEYAELMPLAGSSIGSVVGFIYYAIQALMFLFGAGLFLLAAFGLL